MYWIFLTFPFAFTFYFWFPPSRCYFYFHAFFYAFVRSSVPQHCGWRIRVHLQQMFGGLVSFVSSLYDCTFLLSWTLALQHLQIQGVFQHQVRRFHTWVWEAINNIQQYIINAERRRSDNDFHLPDGDGQSELFIVRRNCPLVNMGVPILKVGCWHTLQAQNY